MILIGNQNKKKIINTSIGCISNCQEDTRYKYEYNGKCVAECTNGLILNVGGTETNKCKCELNKCLTCPTLALKKQLCSECNTGFYKKENDPSNYADYINCYINLKGYYLDKKDNIYKKCFYTCEECEIKGDNTTHNCSKCNNDYPYGTRINTYLNCYENNHNIDIIETTIIRSYNPIEFS